MGAPEEIVAQLDGGRDEGFEVWPDNWAIVEAFLCISTQWRVAPRGGGMGPVTHYWLGLDYAGVAAGLAGSGIMADAELWCGLRIMEAAGRNALNGITETD
jgi:hypothetical protein